MENIEYCEICGKSLSEILNDKHIHEEIAISKTKESLMDLMKKIGAQINVMNLKRQMGTYISMNEIQKKKKEFKELSNVYKRKYFLL